MKANVDGLSVHGATGGIDPNEPERADDPVMLLLHGAGMDGTVWQLQTRYLAHHGYRAIAVDLPGHGRSEGAPLASIEQMADWTHRFLTESGLADEEGPCHVAGHSMGTFIALQLAADRPELVASLTLLGTADAMPVHPDLLSASADQLDRAAALMASWAHAKPAHIGRNPTPGLWMLGGARALVETSPAGTLTADFNACVGYDRALDAASRIACPTTVVFGAGDKMTPPKAGAKLVRALRDGPAGEMVATRTIEDAGHMMMFEAPEPIRQVLAAAAN